MVIQETAGDSVTRAVTECWYALSLQKTNKPTGVAASNNRSTTGVYPGMSPV